jgi:sodium/potassium/calcium exchanger 6
VAHELVVAEAESEVELDPVSVERPTEELVEQQPHQALLLLPKSRFRSVALFRRKWGKKSTAQRALWLALAAVRLPLSVSCPDLRPSKWDSLWVAGTFLCSPFVLVFASGFLPSSLGGAVPVWAATLVVAVGLCVASLFLFRGPAPPQDWRLLPLAFWTFLLSIAWIYLLAHELVGILQALGMLMRISDVILGATVLAWGSSVGDTVSNILVAKKGSPETAIAAAFGGPLFNLLFGSSVSLLYMTVKLYPAQYAAPLHLDSLVTAIFLVGNIAVCAAVVHWQKYTIPRWFAVWLFGVYLAYDVVLVLFGAGIVNNPFIN